MKRLAWLALLLALPTASAEVEGDCHIRINEQDLGAASTTNPDGAIRVATADDIAFNMSLPAETTFYRIIVGIGPIERVLQEGPVETQGRVFNLTGNVSMAQYENAASGLYIIRAEATGDDGEVCAAAGLLSFQPGKILTATMAVAGVAVVGGGTGLGATVVQALKESKDKLDAVKDFKQYLVAATQAIRQ